MAAVGTKLPCISEYFRVLSLAADNNFLNDPNVFRRASRQKVLASLFSCWAYFLFVRALLALTVVTALSVHQLQVVAV